MKVYVPATPLGLKAQVLPAILADGYRAEVVPMIGEEDYFNLIRRAWRARSTFAIVEHDIELLPGMLRQMDACPEPWCAHSYDVYAGDLATVYGNPHGLGFTRFTDEVIKATPEMADHLAGWNPDASGTWAPRSYALLDSGVAQLLTVHGFTVHHHRPNVIHHHVYNRNTDEVFWPHGFDRFGTKPVTAPPGAVPLAP